MQKLSKRICGSRGLKIRNAAELCCVIKTITALATIFEAVDDSQYFKIASVNNTGKPKGIGSRKAQ